MRFIGSVVVGAAVFLVISIILHEVGVPRVVALVLGGVACFLTIIKVNNIREE